MSPVTPIGYGNSDVADTFSHGGKMTQFSAIPVVSVSWAGAAAFYLWERGTIHTVFLAMYGACPCFYSVSLLFVFLRSMERILHLP